MSVDEIVRKLLRRAIERWYSPTGLLAALGAIALTSIILFAGIDLEDVSRREGIFIAVLLIATVLYWAKTRIKTAKKGTVGFGVAITYEDADESRQLRADFVETLKRLINDESLGGQFSFIDFPESHAKKALVDSDGAAWLANKSRVSFLIYGRARVREINAEPNHVLDLHWLVKHGPLSKEMSAAFLADAKEAVPGRLNLKVGDLFAGELSAKLVDAGRRYIIGTAAGTTGAFEYSETLLLQSERTLIQHASAARGTHAPALLQKVRARIADNYLAWGFRHMRRFSFKTRNNEELTAAEPVFQKLRKYDPDSYSAKLFFAMSSFLLRRDVAAARRELQQCRRETDATWMYSEAFLLAYEGDLDDAYKVYRKAFEAPINDPSIVNQSEEFIQGVLDAEPDKAWLWFCAGLINFRAKEDLAAAQHDFIRFAHDADPARFKKHIEIARSWLTEIAGSLRATSRR
jgi:hypothetical protein